MTRLKNRTSFACIRICLNAQVGRRNFCSRSCLSNGIFNVIEDMINDEGRRYGVIYIYRRFLILNFFILNFRFGKINLEMSIRAFYIYYLCLSISARYSLDTLWFFVLRFILFQLGNLR